MRSSIRELTYSQQTLDFICLLKLGGVGRSKPALFSLCVLLAIVAGLLAGCMHHKTASAQKFSLGTNGSLLVSFDEQRRVQEFKQFYADGTLKLRVSIAYAERDAQRFTVFDSSDRKVWETTFTSFTESGSGRGSDVPDPGWEIRYRNDWSGMLGNVHDTRAWHCGADLLYRVHRSWPDDRSYVRYEVSGPTGIILFTNTYVER